MFQYYLPGIADRSHLIRALLVDRGLGQTLRDYLSESGVMKLRASANTLQGPDKGHGLLVSPLPPDDSVPDGFGYHPARQTWIHIAPHDDLGYWLGWSPASLPGPNQLRRSTPLISGYDIELADGNAWTCPRIRIPDGRPDLPATMGVDAGGNYVERVLPAYESAWSMAGEMFEVFLGERDVDPPQSLDYCVRCLALNYRVGPHEITALGVLTTENYPAVFRAAFDGDLINEFLKDHDEQLAERLDAAEPAEKKSDDSASPMRDPDTPPGPAVASPDTAQVAANSGCTPTAL